MIKKTQNFLNMMQKYSTPSGIKQLETMMQHFAENAEVKVKQIITEKVYQAREYVDSHFNLPHARHLGSEVMNKEDPGLIFITVKKTLDHLQAILPEVINDVKFAKREVSSVSEQLHTVFSTFEEKGPHLFGNMSQLYSTMWTWYFILFATITVGVIFYAFWATGWFGGPTVDLAQLDDPEGEGYQPPSGFMGSCQMCCSACSTCMSSCHDNMLCFWSCIILCEAVVLMLFMVAVALTLFSGVKAFMGSGCSEIYFLSDNTVCDGILDVVKGWLAHFWDGAETRLEHACDSESLLTCKLIQDKLLKSVLYTTVGSVAAAVLSFQMIVNTAQMHEQARWIRLAESFSKEC